LQPVRSSIEAPMSLVPPMSPSGIPSHKPDREYATKVPSCHWQHWVTNSLLKQNLLFAKKLGCKNEFFTNSTISVWNIISLQSKQINMKTHNNR
jgi:hypothetical protein